MLITMKRSASNEQAEAVKTKVTKLGFTPVEVHGSGRDVICVKGECHKIDTIEFSTLPGVLEVLRISKTYKLVSREVHPEDTVIDLDGTKIGGNHEPIIMAGPCSVESPEKTLEIAREVSKLGVNVFRAGAFKPRTSPYSFQGHKLDGLKTLAKVREETGMKIITEAVDTETIHDVAEYADIIQIGTRNMYNYSLLNKAGKLNKPVMLKRGLSATLSEFLNAAEYIMNGGNTQVILCERGVRTFSTHSRNTLDLNAIPKLREETHLPIVVDPSHGIGVRNFIRPMSRAALACGAQGLIIETHVCPDEALSDGAQTITVNTLSGILKDREHLLRLEKLS
jgi:3-deoxy-7-phosphoheptulonate synthase